MKQLLAALVVLSVTTAVGSTTACSDVTGSCVTAIEVTNDSVTNQTYEIVIDGIRFGAITPGQSDSWEVSPGPHIVETNFAGGGIACSPALPTVEECQTRGLVCRA